MLLRSLSRLTAAPTTSGTVHEAAERGSIEALQRHLDVARDLGYPDKDTLTRPDPLLGAFPIHYAAENGHANILEFLTQKGVDTLARDGTGVTPLHLAAIRGHMDVVSFLLNNGCGPEHRDIRGDTPMHWAATKDHVDVMDVLHSFGGSIDSPNFDGWTPLLRAAACGCAHAIVWLLNKGANIHFARRDGNTALHLACMENKLQCVHLLLEAGALRDALNHQDQSPEDLASSEGVRAVLAEHARAHQKMCDAQSAAPEGPPSATSVTLQAPPIATEMRSYSASSRRSSFKASDGFPLASDSPLHIATPATIFEDSSSDVSRSPTPESPGSVSPSLELEDAMTDLRLGGVALPGPREGSRGSSVSYSVSHSVSWRDGLSDRLPGPPLIKEDAPLNALPSRQTETGLQLPPAGAQPVIRRLSRDRASTVGQGQRSQGVRRVSKDLAPASQECTKGGGGGQGGALRRLLSGGRLNPSWGRSSSVGNRSAFSPSIRESLHTPGAVWKPRQST
eukprot:jgi/Botrbrau1/13976/Bobra.117_2s0006.1